MKMNKKAFTLVEMLIVIVIIGILAAAILPRLMGARDKANDTARTSSINQLNTAILSYSYTKGNYPVACGSISSLSGDATFMSQIDNIPTDPNKKNTFSVGGNNNVVGNYGYCAITKGGNPDSAYVLVAKVSDPSAANYVSLDNNDPLAKTNLNGTEYSELKSKICSSVTITGETKGTGTNGPCTVKKEDFGKLRYIVVKS